MSTSKLTGNNLWIENARAIATVAVILLHVSADALYTIKTDGPSTSWWIGNIIDGLTRFSVPLFFMISGALLLSKDYELIDYLKKRFVKIIPPFIFWSLVYLFYHNLIYERTFETLYEFAKIIARGLLSGSEDHLWFVYDLIGLYLFVPIIRAWIKHSKRNGILYFLIIWGVTILAYNPYIQEYIPEINLVNFTRYMGYMVLGYYLTTITVKNNYLPLLLIALGAFATIYGTYVESVAINKYSGIYYDYLSINVVVFSIGVFLLFKNNSINNSVARKIISFISDHSYGVYLSHILVWIILEKNGLDWTVFNPLISIPLITLCCLVGSLLLIYILRKVKYLNIISG